jgi:hypothetical protein
MVQGREIKSTRWQQQRYVMLLSGLALCVWLPSLTSALSDKVVNDQDHNSAHPAETESALAVWKKNKDQGWAAYNLGKAFQTGKDGVKKNASKAVSFYLIGAKANYAMAQANLGYCYETGLGVEQDLNKAIEWYRSAAELGNRFGQLNYANMLLAEALNLENETKMLEAKDWYMKAYYQDETLIDAAYGIGLAHSRLPNKSPQDNQLAKRWFALAAAENHPDAQFALGYLDETVGNNKSAFRLYEMAKKSGSLDAIFNLGRCYEYGIGVAQSLALAKKNYDIASLRGHPESQYALGLLVYNSAKTEIEFEEVYMWWSLAKNNGLPKASSALKKLQDARLLSPKGIVAASNAAAKFEQLPPPAKQQTNRFNKKTASRKEIEIFAAAGFFVSQDGWLVTSSKALNLDQQTLTLESGYEISIITEAGIFSVADSIYISKEYDIAAIKVSGEFSPPPLSSNSDAPGGSSLYAVTLDTPSAHNFAPQIVKGTVSEQSVRQRDNSTFILKTTEIPNSLSYFMIFDMLGQAVGFSFESDYEQKTELFGITSNIVKNFLIDNIPSLSLNDEIPKGEPSEIALTDRARQCVATVIVRRKQ